MAESYANVFTAIVAAGITDSATSVTVDAAVPGAGASDTFRLRNERTGELLNLTAGANTTTWTIARAAEDASRFPAAAMLTSDELHVVLTAAALRALPGVTGDFALTGMLTVGSNAVLVGEAASVLALRSATTPQVARIYNTWTDASNYERMSIGWATNIPRITYEKAGTGADRPLTISGLKELILEQTGDTFGTTRCLLRNRSNENGAIFENVGLDLVDFICRPSSGSANQRNIRLENRSADVYVAAPELQIGKITGGVNPALVVTDTGVLVRQGALWLTPNVSAPAAATKQTLGLKALTELTTVAAAATTSTTIQIPAHAVVLAVSVRVTVAIPTATTFTVGDGTTADKFNTGASVAVAANTTNAGTKAGPVYYSDATSIVLTPSATPATNAGRVRVTIYYYDSTPPIS